MDDIDALFRALEPGIRRNLERDGYVRPMLMLDAQRDPATGAPCRAFIILDVTRVMRGETGSTVLDAYARDAVRRHDARLVVLITEIWHAADDGSGRRAQDRPDRAESVLLLVETPAEQRAYCMPIERAADARPTILPSSWRVVTGLVGNLCNLFPKDVRC